MHITVSIIIPTKNEGSFLPKLLDSIYHQKTQYGFEIIVADAQSYDDTLAIAHQYMCNVIEGGIPGVGRNNGARIAKGDYLVFLDADGVIAPDAIEKWITHLQTSQCSIGTPYVRLRTDEKHRWANIYYLSSELSYHIGCVFGICLIIKRDLFEKIGGFNKDIYLLEDVEMIRRARLYSKRLNLYPVCFTSGRRFQIIGTWKMMSLTTWWYILSLFGIYYKKDRKSLQSYKL